MEKTLKEPEKESDLKKGSDSNQSFAVYSHSNPLAINTLKRRVAYQRQKFATEELAELQAAFVIQTGFFTIAWFDPKVNFQKPRSVTATAGTRVHAYGNHGLKVILCRHLYDLAEEVGGDQTVISMDESSQSITLFKKVF